MMKNLVMSAVALAAVVSGAEVRADLIDITNAELARVSTIENATDKLRVYVSRNLIVERKTQGTDEVEVDDGIDVVYEDRILREVVKRGARGKIVAIEGDETPTSADSMDKLGLRTIYVSFDTNCVTKECAFAFTRGYENDSYCGYYSCSYSRTFKTDSYILSAVPANPDYSSFKVFSKKGLMKRELLRNTHNVLMAAKGYKYSVRLQVDTEELRRVIKNSLEHEGWD